MSLDHKPDNDRQAPNPETPKPTGAESKIDISGLLRPTEALPRPMSKAERLAAERARKKKPGKAVIAIATGAGVLVTGLIGFGIAGAVSNGRGREVPTAGALATPGGVDTPSQEASPSTVSGGEIPADQLNILKPTKTYEELEQLSVDDFAQESVPNRALWGYNFANQLITDNTGSVKTNDRDTNSFDDPNFTGGDKTLSLINNIYAHAAGMTELQARKVVLAFNFDPLDPATGTVSAEVQEAMDAIASQADGKGGDIPIPYARKETPWKLTPTSHGGQEWGKVVYYQTKRTSETAYSGDTTSQLVRITVKDPTTGNVDVCPIYGNSSHGNALDKLANEQIR